MPRVSLTSAEFVWNHLLWRLIVPNMKKLCKELIQKNLSVTPCNVTFRSNNVYRNHVDGNTAITNACVFVGNIMHGVRYFGATGRSAKFFKNSLSIHEHFTPVLWNPLLGLRPVCASLKYIYPMIPDGNVENPNWFPLAISGEYTRICRLSWQTWTDSVTT